jgi:Domain of unknown function (DUF4388)
MLVCCEWEGWQNIMRRPNPAEKLSDVIDLLCARHYSGLLSVERFEGRRFEEGEIYFEQGCPVYACYNQKTSKEAFARLETWRQVYFAFNKNVPCPLSRDIPPPSLLPPSEPNQLSQPLSSGELRWDTLPRLRAAPRPLSNVAQLVPHRSEVKQNILSLPLTRAQRAVYLLVDGKRTVVDLARCIGKSIQDVIKLLNELLGLGLILI